MITTLMGLGAGPRLAKLIAYLVLPLLVLGLIWWGVRSYADGVADAREAKVHAAYQEASERLKAEAARSATRADDAAAIRLEQHQQHVQQEQEQIDEAQRQGLSPFDVMFGGP